MIHFSSFLVVMINKAALTKQLKLHFSHLTFFFFAHCKNHPVLHINSAPWAEFVLHLFLRLKSPISIAHTVCSTFAHTPCFEQVQMLDK